MSDTVDFTSLYTLVYDLYNIGDEQKFKPVTIFRCMQDRYNTYGDFIVHVCIVNAHDF